MKSVKIFLPVFLLLNISIIAQKDSARIAIDEWLTAGPIHISLPVEAGKGESKYKDKDLLNFEPIEPYRITPQSGENLSWGKEDQYDWKSKKSAQLELSASGKDIPNLSYAVTYLEAKRWIKAKLEVKSCQMFNVYIDGKEIMSKTSSQSAKGGVQCKPEKESKEIELERGSHVLVIKAVKGAKAAGDWNLTTALLIDSAYSAKDITFSTKRTEYATVEKLLEDQKIGDISISSDGELAAVTVSQIPFGEDAKETWIDIYRTSDGTLFRSFKGSAQLSSVKWSPKGKKLAYTSTDKNETTLWVIDFGKEASQELLSAQKDFTDFTWAPDESFIIYTITEKASENKSGIKIIKGMNERLPGADNKSYLYKLSLPGNVKTRLTAGEKSFDLNSISRDSKKLLLSVQDYDWNKRPYSYSTFYILNLPDMKLDSLTSLSWSNTAQFSPQGDKILFTGGPSMFGKTGNDVSGDVIPNEFDTQAYIYDIKTGNGDHITRNFIPSVEYAYWSTVDDVIYFHTTDKAFQHLYKYNVTSKKFHLVNLSVDVLDKIQYADGKNEAVYKGSSPLVPDKFYYINLTTGESKLLFDPVKESYKNVTLGTTEKWTFKNSSGEEIDGTIYYPPNFDKTKKYPAIINYYGGTSPIDEAFEGRYPKNIWAANGYVVYVLQPSGAVGYGQQFSAHHVNDWGNTTAQEVIDGTKLFLREHPFVDSTKIGCIGASYGGFLTMNLLTKTDMFTAGISHAGISNLADYWGVGYWGYSYSAGATANSFPWNRKDIYVDYSPIFSADKINTPLLLLHGASDTNVPPGESTQMFTALKLLGKDVEYIQVADQDHHILEYKKRKQWTKTIIAYFDKYLKNQPQWWDSMYSKKE